MIVALLLLIINIFILMNTREPEKLTEVREKYRILRENLKETGNEKFEMLHDEVPITAYYKMRGSVGYNTNKASRQLGQAEGIEDFDWDNALR